jgi:hypothetical protein
MPKLLMVFTICPTQYTGRHRVISKVSRSIAFSVTILNIDSHSEVCKGYNPTSLDSLTLLVENEHRNK